MTAELFSKWHHEVWQTRKSSFFKLKSLPIVDSGENPFNRKVHKQIKKHSNISFIPRWLKNCYSLLIFLLTNPSKII